MITMAEAKGLALDAIATATGRDKKDLAFLDGSAECKRYGWILFYNTRAFVETGDFLEALGGNGPVVVTHEGKVFMLGTGASADAIIRAFESERGWG